MKVDTLASLCAQPWRYEPIRDTGPGTFDKTAGPLKSLFKRCIVL